MMDFTLLILECCRGFTLLVTRRPRPGSRTCTWSLPRGGTRSTTTCCRGIGFVQNASSFTTRTSCLGQCQPYHPIPASFYSFYLSPRAFAVGGSRPPSLHAVFGFVTGFPPSLASSILTTSHLHLVVAVHAKGASRAHLDAAPHGGCGQTASGR